MGRKITLAEGEFYHVYNRGNNRRSLFIDEEDKNRFMKLLYISNTTQPIVFKELQDTSFKALRERFSGSKRLTALGAYCLMPNHFHLLLKETQKNGISLFMQKFATAYSMYFNKKTSRTGSLFEGRYRAEHVRSDNYLKYLFAYIHLNPIKLIEPHWKEEGINDIERSKNFLRQYPFSSYFDYRMQPREEVAILSRDEFPEYFQEEKDFATFIDFWLSFSGENEFEEKEDAHVPATIEQKEVLVVPQP